MKYSNIEKSFVLCDEAVYGRNEMAMFQDNNKWENNICIIYLLLFLLSGEVTTKGDRKKNTTLEEKGRNVLNQTRGQKEK